MKNLYRFLTGEIDMGNKQRMDKLQERLDNMLVQVNLQNDALLKMALMIADDRNAINELNDFAVDVVQRQTELASHMLYNEVLKAHEDMKFSNEEDEVLN